MIWIDIETYNETPISYGTARYAETAELLLFAYARDQEPVKVWDVTAQPDMPHDLMGLLTTPGEPLVAHNAVFEATVLNAVMPTLFRAARLTPGGERWRCTMAQALAHSLPGSLDALGDLFGLGADKAKSKEGKDLVNLFCKPRPKNSKLRRATRETHPEKWEAFKKYCALDVEAMRELYAKMPKVNYPSGNEADIWQLDQRINARGVLIDLDLVNAAITTAETEQAHLADRVQHLTDGDVQAATQRDAVLRHVLATYGIELPDLRTATVERFLNTGEDIPWPLRELLEVRLAASTTSTAKYKRLKNYTSKDGRLRCTLQYCGASRTGRWAGRGPQFQNLPRPTLKPDQIETGIRAVKAGCANMLLPEVMPLLSSAIRSVIIAPHGKKLCIADLSNIEGRALAWEAGEAWKIQAFRDYDAGLGPDLYKLAYAKAFGIPPDRVTPDMRQIGKVMELALGYGGGVGAFITFATAFGIDLDKLASDAWNRIPEPVKGRAHSSLSYMRKMGGRDPLLGLAEGTWIVCESFKIMWRDAHPATVQFWKDIESQAKNAVNNPGVIYSIGDRFKLISKNGWLYIRLPSGRALSYPGVQILDDGQLSYMGINQYSRKWQRLRTYSGKIVENITQAVSRDVLAYNMLDVENAGYEIVLSVHDELLTETPDTDEYSAERLSQLMSANKPWSQGLPLAAAGFETYRYRKG